MSDAVRLPNFLFIGAAKCGSTWLFEALRAHPQVFVPPAKDVYYFDQYYHKGPAWYASFFKDAPGSALAVGELSHDYLYSRDALERIAADLPGVRLLATLRDPIDRAYSTHLFHRRNRTGGATFDETVKLHPNTVERGLYAEMLALYIDRFGRDRVMVTLFDDLKADPRKLARDVYCWLGVDETFEHKDVEKKVLAASRPRLPWVSAAAKRAAWMARRAGMANLVGRVKRSPQVNRWLYKPIDAQDRSPEPPLTPDQRARLRDYYRDDVQRLGALIERDLSHWLA